MKGDLGCEFRLREAISLERDQLELSDKAVLQALDKVREELYLAVKREAVRQLSFDEEVGLSLGPSYDAFD